MTTTVSGKINTLVSPKPAALDVAKLQSTDLLRDCRELAIDRLCRVCKGILDKVGNELDQLADEANNPEARDLYLDTGREAHEKRDAIMTALRQQFIRIFDDKTARLHEPSAVLQKIENADLALVDDSALEELAIAGIARRLIGKCSQELQSLSQHMAPLLSVAELSDETNPLSPDTFVKALRTACDQMAAGFQAKLIIMKMVESHITIDFLNLYRELNAMLVSNSTLSSAARVPGRETIKSGSTLDAIAATHQDVRSPAEIMASLRHLIGRSPGTKPVTTDSFAPIPGPTRGPVQINVGQSGKLFAVLTRLQRQAGMPGAAALNVLHALKTQPDLADSSSLDAMTIDVVAKLFDCIFDDKTTLNIVKNLLARLQIPILKVALFDKRFFSQKNHPARRLLNALADASTALTDEAAATDPLYLKLAEIVGRVQTEFEIDTGIVDACLEALQAFRATYDAKNADVVERSARALHENEKREMARVVAQYEIEQRVTAALPAPVAAMMQGPWARVLENYYLHELGRGPAFTEALETADQLIWSVMPKMESDDRKNLVSILPIMLQRLQQGLDTITVSPDDRERFFAALIDCHAAAVKAGLRGEGAPLLDSVHADIVTAPLFVKLVAEAEARRAAADNRSGVVKIQFDGTEVHIEELTLQEGRHASARVSTEAANGSLDMNAMSMLKRGTWVEFRYAGRKPLRARLSWVSPLKGVYLFTNPSAMEALSLTPGALLMQLHDGRVRILDDTPLVERAVAKMVASLRTGKKVVLH